MKMLYFSAKWCGPCQRVSPIFKKLQAELDIEMEKIDVDEDLETARALNVQAMPTFILLNDTGEEVARTVGVKNESELREFASQK